MTEKSIANYELYLRDVFTDTWSGDKFVGSFGQTKLLEFCDYWTLRKRSLQLFTENLYAKGIIRRILRNEIFTGLVPDASPLASILWPDKSETEREQLAVEYGERMTEQFNLYANNYEVFDWRKQLTFGEFQNQVRMEALLCGDGIIVSRINYQTGLPCWDWINGNHITTPACGEPRSGNYIKNGVELDRYGRHVAYYVQKMINGEIQHERIPVKGEKSGRQISWMVYGSEKMIDDVRGEPLLSCMLYMLKELDRYRDAEARAAVINSLIAFIVKKSPTATIGTRPTAGLTRLRTSDGGLAEGGLTDNADGPHRQPVELMTPGTAFDDLAPGETVEGYQTVRPNVNYRAFEEAILNAICWALEIPPEIVMLRFTSSYSASRQANNEFEVYLKFRTFKNAKDFCQIVYEEFIIQSVVIGQLDLPDFLTSVFISTQWQKRAAWLSCAWTGISRPSVDRTKDVKASHDALNDGLSTFDIECRRISGLSFRQVMQRRKREVQYMEQVGFTPAVDENNKGEPLTTNVSSDDPDGDE